MLFTVISIEKENDNTFVTGSTAVGYIKGLWKGDEQPVVGSRHHIELNFPTVDKSAVSVTTADIGTKIIGDKTSFVGLCEDIDKIFYIRFSVHGLEMLDIIDGEEKIKQNDHVSFSLPFSDIGIHTY